MPDRPDETEAIRRYLTEDTGIPSSDWLADDAVWRHWRWGERELVGRAKIKHDYFDKLDEAYGDWTFTVEEAFVDRDTLIVRGFFRGFFSNDFHGVKATNAPVTWRAHDIFRFKDGKIAEAWYGNDTYAVAREMGVIPQDAPWPWHLPNR